MTARIKYRLLKDNKTSYWIIEKNIWVFLLSNREICIEYLKGKLQKEFIWKITIINYDVCNINYNYSCINNDN